MTAIHMYLLYIVESMKEDDKKTTKSLLEFLWYSFSNFKLYGKWYKMLTNIQELRFIKRGLSFVHSEKAETFVFIIFR
jgi:hypothetical protein